jgi:hypothetical protein
MIHETVIVMFLFIIDVTPTMLSHLAHLLLLPLLVPIIVTMMIVVMKTAALPLKMIAVFMLLMMIAVLMLLLFSPFKHLHMYQIAVQKVGHRPRHLLLPLPGPRQRSTTTLLVVLNFLLTGFQMITTWTRGLTST